MMANKQLAEQKTEIEALAADLLAANERLVLQNEEKEKRAQELIAFNKELKDTQEQLKLVIRELEAFSYSVSHDLRAPLRAVGSYAKMLEEDYTDVLDANGKRLLNIIQQSAVKMGMLIDDLLKLSRLGKNGLQKGSVNMTLSVHRILQDLQDITGYRAEIIVHPLHSVSGDGALINHALTNLLSNAVKYSAKSPNPRIEIKSYEDKGEIIFCIADNGVGFDMNYVHKLFGVFQRLHSDKEFEGTGVGLAIVKRIIEMHGGRVWAKGEIDKGASFYFALPSSE